ncbi:hypothetical protein [Nesterenkonia pannonica]|uniref:hypothetical protein n=1 Tax=Nesterenkonia pannonica TaxID=1548602 RepID=UPI0021647042|nr:hypothetical protein [Nesterenkonia pannonica]
MAGVFNRLQTDIMGRTVETEHMVNIPDWTFLQVTPEVSTPLLPGSPELVDYFQELDMRRGLHTRVARYEDLHGRRTKVTIRQFQALANVHLGCMEVKLEAENWSGNVGIRSMVDGRVANRNVAADRELAKQSHRAGRFARGGRRNGASGDRDQSVEGSDRGGRSHLRHHTRQDHADAPTRHGGDLVVTTTSR